MEGEMKYCRDCVLYEKTIADINHCPHIGENTPKNCSYYERKWYLWWIK